MFSIKTLRELSISLLQLSLRLFSELMSQSRGINVFFSCSCIVVFFLLLFFLSFPFFYFLSFFLFFSGCVYVHGCVCVCVSWPFGTIHVHLNEYC